MHRSFPRPDFVSWFWAALSGLLLAAAFPKTGWDFLSWAALVPLFWAVNRKTPSQAARLGLVFGVVHFSLVVYWVVIAMTVYGGVSYLLAGPILILMAAFLGLYPAMFCLVTRWCAATPMLFLVAAPASWVGLEFVRLHFLTGFPWCSVGHAFYTRTSLIQIADITGVYGLSYLVVLVNAAIFVALCAARKIPVFGRNASFKTAVFGLGTALVLLSGVLGYGKWRMAETDALAAKTEKVRVAVIQGNIDQAVKWDPSYQAATIEKYEALTRLASRGKPDIVIWPESAMPFHFLRESVYTGRVLDLMRETGSSLLAGSPYCEPDGEGWRCFNRAYLVSPDGSVTGHYDKVHLVPWGEYVPLKKWMPFIDKLTQEVGDFEPGQPGRVLYAGKAKIGLGICYEIIFPALSRKQVENGANLLATITNDAWYDRSSAAYQHFAIASFRAVENRRALARAANTGISGFVEPCGRIGQTTALFTDAWAVVELPLLESRTVYSRVGDLFSWLCAISALFLILLGFKKRLDS